MEYTKQDLEKKKVTNLKDILKDLNLRLQGNKSELIDRILANQNLLSKPEIISKDNTYFSLLPSDISNIVNRYRIENEPNNQIAFEIIKDVGSGLGWKWKDLDNLLEKLNLPFDLKQNENKNKPISFLFVIEKQHQLVTEDMLISLILNLLQREIGNYNIINGILRQYNSPLRVDVQSIGIKKTQYRYTVGYFKPIKSVDT